MILVGIISKTKKVLFYRNVQIVNVRKINGPVKEPTRGLFLCLRKQRSVLSLKIFSDINI